MKLPYAPVEFTRDGRIADEARVRAALDVTEREHPTDLLLLAHGWNNDVSAAEALFTRLSDNVADLLEGFPERRLTVIGLLWPSVRWADDDAVAGGGASAPDPATALEVAIAQSVDDPATASALRRAAAALEGSRQGRADFVAALRDLLPPGAGEDTDEDPVPTALVAGDVEEVFAAAEEAVFLLDDEDEFRATTGGAAAPGVPPGGFPDLLADTNTAGTALGGFSRLVLARQLLNLTTFYTMKDRAGKVGDEGVATLLDRLHAAAPRSRVHLAGHSFGARVVTAAAAASRVPISSLTLLQGAFSHFAFARDYGRGREGAFRGVLTGGQLAGPVVVTHTHNDRAVRTAYALASRVARQTGAGIGDHNDPYGGIGANGAVATQEADDSVVLQDVGAEYRFLPGRVHNLRADRFVAGHSSVSGRQVAHALAAAITS